MTEPVRALHYKSCSHPAWACPIGIEMASQQKKDVLAFHLFKQGFFEPISITSWNKTSSGKLLDLTEPRSRSGLQFQLCYRVKYHSNN